MGKGPKLGLSFLNSIQICRTIDPSTLVKTPLPHSHISKTYDISLPTFPDLPSSSNHLSTSTKSNHPQNEPKLFIMHQKIPTQEYTTVKREDTHKLNERAPIRKKERIMMKKPKASLAGNDNSSSSSSSSSCKQSEEPLSTNEKSGRRTRRFKRYGSKDWKDSNIAEQTEKLEQMQVNENFVVLKRSADPYHDFKRSMLEMIVERRIFEPTDLEQLLMSFLSLNSRIHHKAILKAFSDIWKEVFTGP